MKQVARCVTLALILATTPALAFGNELWIPAAASNPGLHGSMWSTDLWIMNRVLDASIEVTAEFFPEQEGSATPEEAVITVEPGRQIEIPDAVMTLFGEHRPGAIRLYSTDPFSAQSRTANNAGPDGSFGQGIPAFPATDAAEAWTFLGAANRPGNAGLRTNIGLVNLGDEEERISIFARDSGTHADLGTRVIDVGPGGWVQRDVFALFGVDQQAIELADVSVFAPGSRLLGYLSRVDNRSGDGTFIAPTVAAFVHSGSGEWELKAVLTFEDAMMDWWEYNLPDGTVVRVDDPESGTDTGTLIFTGPARFCARASGEAGPGPEWGTLEISIDRRPVGGTWYRGRHRYSTEPGGEMVQEYCVDMD
jgi:hypothetical protein